MPTTLQTIATIVMIISLVLAWLNYRRNRANLSVCLQWDVLLAIRPPPLDQQELRVGRVTVTNIGRSRVHVSRVALKLPKTSPNKYLTLATDLKLSEGDAFRYHINDQDQFKPHAKHWKQIRVVGSTSTGKAYYSNRVKTRPSWADPSTPATTQP